MNLQSPLFGWHQWRFQAHVTVAVALRFAAFLPFNEGCGGVFPGLVIVRWRVAAPVGREQVPRAAPQTVRYWVAARVVLLFYLLRSFEQPGILSVKLGEVVCSSGCRLVDCKCLRVNFGSCGCRMMRSILQYEYILHWEHSTYIKLLLPIATDLPVIIDKWIYRCIQIDHDVHREEQHQWEVFLWKGYHLLLGGFNNSTLHKNQNTVFNVPHFPLQIF